jgi:hypothetical protein
VYLGHDVDIVGTPELTHGPDRKVTSVSRRLSCSALSSESHGDVFHVCYV